MADDELIEYVVVTDMVTITKGNTPKGDVEVYRLERGQHVQAPLSNESVQELLAMGGLVRLDSIKKDMAALNKRGSLRRPTVTSDPDAVDDLRYRVTAAGTATMLAGPGEELPLVIEEAAPLSAENPDLSTVV